MKIKEALSKAIVYLNERKFTDPLYESRLILSLILEKDISFIYAYLDLELEPKDEEKFFQILKMRQSGQPLQYILEETYFMGKKFKINRGVLIPRKETEISVEVITDIIKKNKCKSFLEIGCGSGIVTIMVNLLTNINCSCLIILIPFNVLVTTIKSVSVSHTKYIGNISYRNKNSVLNVKWFRIHLYSLSV